MPSSSESSSCRIDWRPSRLLCVAFAGLGALAAIALALSALPWPLKPALAALALARGLQLARREWRRPPCRLEFGSDGADAMIHREGRVETLHAPRLALRGLLATLAWRDPRSGRAQALYWSADTLSPSARRRLRLRFGGEGAGA
jgi:toxin CptA